MPGGGGREGFQDCMLLPNENGPHRAKSFPVGSCATLIAARRALSSDSH
jgi:hypothetical protein